LLSPIMWHVSSRATPHAPETIVAALSSDSEPRMG
jgi:hypothetical protein